MTNVILLFLATYRLSTDFSREHGPFGLYRKARKAVESYVEAEVDKTELEPEDHPLWWLHEGISCYICLSFWASIALYFLPETVREHTITFLAAAGGVTLANDLFNAISRRTK